MIDIFNALAIIENSIDGEDDTTKKRQRLQQQLISKEKILIISCKLFWKILCLKSKQPPSNLLFYLAIGPITNI